VLGSEAVLSVLDQPVVSALESVESAVLGQQVVGSASESVVLDGSALESVESAVLDQPVSGSEAVLSVLDQPVLDGSALELAVLGSAALHLCTPRNSS